MITYRDPTYEICKMQKPMRNRYLDDHLSRNDAKRAIAGRCIAMTAEISICYNCGKKRHYARNCKLKSFGTHNNKQGNKGYRKMEAGSKDAAEHKWWCENMTASHDDTECYVQ